VDDVHRSQRLPQAALAGVEEVVDQGQGPDDVDLAARLVADRLLGDRQRLQQPPEEADVETSLGDLDRTFVQLPRREGLELLARRHRGSLPGPSRPPKAPAIVSGAPPTMACLWAPTASSSTAPVSTI